MTQVRLPEKDELEVRKAMVLLKKQRSGEGSIFTKAQVELKLMALSEHIRSIAEARLVGEHRTAMTEHLAAPGDSRQVAAEWAKVLTKYTDRETKWAQPAVESELKFQMAVVNYSVAMQPLFDALEMAKSTHVPGVKDKATKAYEALDRARTSLQPLSENASKKIDELNHFVALVEHLKAEPPQTMAEVTAAQASFDEAIQAVRNTEDAMKRQVNAINALAKQVQTTVEANIKSMVAAAIAWRKTEDVRTGTEWVETLANGTVNAVQALDGEPLSAVALQGVHMLIKGVCDVVKLTAHGIETRSQNKKEVMDLLSDLEGDDFIQWKLDGIKMGLSWAAEPLGFIPNVGPLVRSCINAAVDFAIGSIKKAAEAQAAAQKRGKKLTAAQMSSEIDEVAGVIQDQITNTLKNYIESSVEALTSIEEYAKGAKDPAEVILSVVAGIFGPPMQKLLAKILPSMTMVDADQIRATLQGGRDAVVGLANEHLEMNKIEQRFGFDETHAKETSTRFLKDMAEGAVADVVVISSPGLESSRGVGLLIGTGHTDDNVSYAENQVQARHGHKGRVTMKSKGGATSRGELVFEFASPEAKTMVESYIEHYGTGDGRVTRKKLTFK